VGGPAQSAIAEIDRRAIAYRQARKPLSALFWIPMRG
jgi:hypothetical protein